MKKLFYTLFVAAALVACSDDEGPQEVIVESATGYTASIEAVEGIPTPAFEEGATISVFQSITNERYKLDASGQFMKDHSLTPKEPFGFTYAIHPYKSASRVQASGDIKMELPSQHAYAADGIDAAALPMVAYAEAGATDISFKNLVGVACVKLYGTAAIKEIAIYGANGEYLSGTIAAKIGEDGEPSFTYSALMGTEVKIVSEEAVEIGLTVEEATSFYIPVPPVTFDNGFTVKVVDSYGNIRKKNFKVDEENPAVSIYRNAVTEVACYELKEKLPTKTILDVQFNEDGTATDAGIYGLDVQLMGEAGVDPFIYKHPKFKANNIARFNHNCHNNQQDETGYYKVDYSANEEMKATIADGFALEVVTANTAWSWDWWSVPVSTDAFRLMRKGDNDNSPWTFTFNNGGGWWPGNVRNINTVLEKNKYHHTVYMYDADNQWIQVYQDGLLLGMEENVTEFLPGQWLSIGGTLDNGNNLAMHWNGEVALVRMYDQVLEPTEIADKFNDLKLPEEGAIAPEVTINTPLLDVKWKEDKSAYNAGSQSSLEVMSMPNDNTTMLNVDGIGYFPNFANAVHNGSYPDGWYRVDYTNDADFKSKLQDGFTLEILCFCNYNPGDFYVRPVSADKWLVHLRCNSGGGHHWWQTCINANNSWWWDWGTQYNGYGYGNKKPVFNKDTGVVMTSYAHYFLIWDADAGKWGTYLDGNFNGGDKTSFDVGNILGICGMPLNNAEQGACHGWPGKVAMVRVYDEVFTQEHVLARYTELQPTIEKLNASNAQ